MSSRISDPRQKGQVQDITADWDNVQIIKSGRDSAHQFDSGVFHMEQLLAARFSHPPCIIVYQKSIL